MKIIYDPKFIDAFNAIWDFIAKDSKIRANDFKNALKNEIENLPYMPYKCRKSIYFNDKKIRDLIFKGYTIVYKVDESKDTILILGIKKYRKEF